MHPVNNENIFIGASKNPEFAQVQGAEKISPRRIGMFDM
jgi:hypothetical protein